MNSYAYLDSVALIDGSTAGSSRTHNSKGEKHGIVNDRRIRNSKPAINLQQSNTGANSRAN